MRYMLGDYRISLAGRGGRSVPMSFMRRTHCSKSVFGAPESISMVGCDTLRCVLIRLRFGGEGRRQHQGPALGQVCEAAGHACEQRALFIGLERKEVRT